MKDDFCKCIAVKLGKYTEGDDPTLDIEAAKHLTKAFSLWFDDCHYDKEKNWLTFELSYVCDMIFAPELLATIKFFAQLEGYFILGSEPCFKPLEGDILQEGC